MKKIEELIEIIKLYNLNGLCDLALLSFHDKSSTVNFYLQEFAFFGEVTYKSNPFEKNVDLPVFETDVLLKLLETFSKNDKVELDVSYKGENLNDDDPHAINIVSPEVKSQFVLADKKIIRNQKNLNKDALEFDYELKLSKDFIDKYFKYSGILKSHDYFSFSAEDYIRINFGNVKKTYENSISLDIAINDGDVSKNNVFFNLDFFTNILKINKEADIVLKFNKSMYFLDINTDRYNCIYVNASKK